MAAVDVADLYVGRRVHRRAHLWRIARRDGAVLRFAEWDREIEFDSEVYTPAGGLDGSASQTDAGFGSTTLEVHGVLSSDAITEVDLWKGLYRGAIVDKYEVDALYPWGGYIEHDRYRIARTFYDGAQWGAEIEGIAKILQQRSGRVAERGCGHDFGDGLCTFDIPGSGLVLTMTIDTVVDARLKFRVESPPAFGTGDYENGSVEFLTGANAGVIVDVGRSTFAAGLPNIGTWELDLPTPFNIEVGDQFKATPGCARTFDDCERWHGTGPSGAPRRYGGFRTLPGTDETVREQ